MADEPPKHEPPFHRDLGTGLRTLLDRIRDEGAIIYTEGGDHLALQPRCAPHDAMRDGVRKHHALFRALATPDESLTDDDKRTILEHDIRVGFTPPGDWAGARRELCERGGMYLG